MQGFGLHLGKRKLWLWKQTVLCVLGDDSRYGFRITEVPIVFVNRVLGTSKMSSGIFSDGFFGVMRLKLGSMFTKYPDYSRK